MNLEAVTSQHNLRGLRHLYDLVESQVRGLKSLGVESSSYGSLLSSVLLQKLPLELRQIVSRETSEADWSLDEILKQLEREIDARERAAMTSSQSAKRQGKDPTLASTAAALLSPSGTPQCCYCKQPHFSGDCGVVMNLDERKQILWRSERCFICLRKYHVSKDCRSTNRCRKCGGRHHRSICAKNSPMNPRSVNPPTASNSPHTQQTRSPPQDSPTFQPGLNPQADAFAPVTSTSMYTDNKTAVLLQTAQTQVYNPTCPQSPMEIRVILDGGSQRSYVTNRVREALSLPTESKQRMLIKTFGSEQEEERLCDVVRISMKTVDGTDLELPFFTVYTSDL